MSTTENFGKKIGPAESHTSPSWKRPCLQEMYGFLQGYYTEKSGNIFNIDPEIRKFHSYTVGGDEFSAVSGESSRRSYVIVVSFRDGEPFCYAGQIEMLFQHTAHFGIGGKVHTFALIKFLKLSGRPTPCSSPLQIEFFSNEWDMSQTYARGTDSIVPIQRICCLFLPVFKIGSDHIFTAAPILRRVQS